MTELAMLRLFLGLAFILAPWMTTSFFLKDSKVYSVAHKTSLIGLLVGAVLNLNHLALIWPLFCIFGFFLYLKRENRSLLSKNGLVGCLPFVFSLISSLWFVAGVYDGRLLGYDTTWSFYASLHGAFFGWVFIGCLAFLSRQADSSPIYLWGCYLCFAFFLLVALGIDGILPTKQVAVIGISFLAPVLIGHYAFNLGRENKLSRNLAALSFVSILVSMTLAMLNEFWHVLPRMIAGIPVMVMGHGVLNAVVAVPCFFLAVRLQSAE